MMHVGLALALFVRICRHHQTLEQGCPEQRLANIAVESTKLITRSDEKKPDNPPRIMAGFL